MAELEDLQQEEKRKQFGNRLLTDPKNVFKHNAWDNVVWDEEQEKEAKSKADEQLAYRAKEEDINRYESNASEFWNKFYGIHENKFFKDRHWLFTEFPELAPESYLSPEKLSALSLSVNDKKFTGTRPVIKTSSCISTTQSSELKTDSGQVPVESSLSDLSSDNANILTESPDKDDSSEDGLKDSGCGERHDCKKEKFPGEAAKYRIFEVGCGVGNTVFPILQANIDPELMVYCCDYSSTAIDLVKENKDYDERRCHAFVCDISNPESVVPFPEGSLDAIILIFILSANNPDRFQAIIKRLASYLRPGGMILFRDYGRYDMAQLRFKKGKCLGENFYVRGDGTRVYFFTQEEMREIMTTAGLVEKQNLVDRRLQVNRGRQLKMYRVWVQCKYMKPTEDDSRKHTEDDSQKQTEDDSQKQTEDDSQKPTEDDSQKPTEDDSQKPTEDDSQKLTEDDSQKQTEDDSQKQTEDDSQKQTEDDSQKQTEDDSQKQTEDDSQKLTEDDSQKQTEDDSQKQTEDDSQKLTEDDSQKQTEDDSQKPTEDDSQKPTEDDSQKQTEDDSQKQTEDDSQKQTEDDSQKLTEDDSQKNSR